jgi:tetratricopeptide (TPR) repeat protein
MATQLDALAHAAAHLNAGRLPEAIQICREKLLRQPAHFDAQYLLGVALLQAGEEAQGEECLRKAAALEPAIINCSHLDATLRQQGLYSPLNSAKERYHQFKRLQTTDAFIISYPKCGRTRVRLMLGKFLHLHFGLTEDAQMLELHALTSRLAHMPRVDIAHDDNPHWKPAAAIERTKDRYRGKKVVLLVRDPRSTLVSYYFQYTRRGDKELANDAAFNGTMSDFVRHRIGGIDSMIAFYNAWAHQRTVPAAFHLVRYEDLHVAPVLTLRKLLKFLDFPGASNAMLERVVSYCAFDNMQRLERENALKSNRLAPADVNDPESFKVRKGKVAGYGEYLTASDMDYINAKLAALDDLYSGYKIHSDLNKKDL